MVIMFVTANPYHNGEIFGHFPHLCSDEFNAGWKLHPVRVSSIYFHNLCDSQNGLSSPKDLHNVTWKTMMIF